MISCLYDLVLRSAQRYPRSKAIIEADTGTAITYKELNAKIRAIANYIVQQGFKKGERVGLLCRNSISWVCAFFAVSKTGGIAVPFNYQENMLEIARQARDCGLSALFAGEGFLQDAKGICRTVDSIRFIIKGTDKAGAPRLTRQVSIGEKDPALIVYTSGSTGRPLGVALSHRNLISNTTSIVKYAGILKTDKVCCVLPLYYIYGLSLVLSHFLAGGAVIIENRFMYPNVALETMARYKATGFAGVSSHYAILLYQTQIKGRSLPALRYFMQAGDAMPAAVTRALLKAFPDKRLYLMYGLTEASPRLSYLEPALALKKSASVGKAVPSVKLRVVDSRGRECPPHQTGEITAAGDNIMLGYWNNRALTKKKLRKGWLYTGDLGYKDEDGDLFIVGRKDGVVKIWGKKAIL